MCSIVALPWLLDRCEFLQKIFCHIYLIVGRYISIRVWEFVMGFEVYRTCQLNVPALENKVDLPVRKMFFWRRAEKMHWWSFFYVNFIEKMYIRAKLKECIKTKCTYQGKYISLKITKFCFYESWSSYKGGTMKNRPVRKVSKSFRSGGTFSWQVR